MKEDNNRTGVYDIGSTGRNVVDTRQQRLETFTRTMSTSKTAYAVSRDSITVQFNTELERPLLRRNNLCRFYTFGVWKNDEFPLLFLLKTIHIARCFDDCDHETNFKKRLMTCEDDFYKSTRFR